MTSFLKTNEWKVETLPLVRYYSEKYGTTVVFAKAKSEIVYATMAFGTKVFNNHGAPHALEHLVFMGSEEYPYKGALDHMAHQSFSRGTNAWTATDHTAYTWDCAGNDGCMRLLPVFLNHVLSPKLTKSSIWSEVYHVKEDGKEGGVVFAEMEAREKSQGDRVFKALGEIMYSPESCYASETGGTLEGLRKITHKELVEFHKEHYDMSNMTLIFVGNVDEDQALTILDRYGESHEHNPRTSRVWDIQCEITSNAVKTVYYPSDNTELGAVVLAWEGPEWDNFIGRHSFRAIGSYLTHDPTSLCSTELVDKGYCSDVSFEILNYKKTTMLFYFDNVPIDKMEELHTKFDEILNTPFDIDRIQLQLKRNKIQYRNAIEKAPKDTIESQIIQHSLYDGDECTLPSSLSPVSYWDSLLQMPDSYWSTFIDAFKSKPNCVILAIPEVENKTDDTLRTPISEPNDGIDNHIPESFWDNYKMLDPPEITSTDIITHGNMSRIVTNSDFNRHIISMSSRSLSEGQRMFLPLFVECLFELSTKQKTFEEVTQTLKEHSISYGASIGWGGSSISCGAMSSHIFMSLVTEKDKIDMGEELLRMCIVESVFDSDRVSKIGARLIKNLNDYVDDGITICRNELNRVTYDWSSNRNITNINRQIEFIKNAAKKIDKTVQILDTIRSVLLNGINICVIGNSADVEYSNDWQTEIYTLPEPEHTFRNIEFTKIERNLTSTDSSFIMINTPCTTEKNPQVQAALSVVTEYLTMQEGPLWNTIRGSGLAYSFGLNSSVSTGMTTFTLYRATRTKDAIAEAKRIIEHIPKSISSQALNEAKSSVIVSIIESMTTEHHVALLTYAHSLQKFPSTWTNEMLAAIQQVTIQHVCRAWETYLIPLFDSRKSNIVIVKRMTDE